MRTRAKRVIDGGVRVNNGGSLRRHMAHWVCALCGGGSAALGGEQHQDELCVHDAAIIGARDNYDEG